MTEITCHGRGACFVHGSENLTVIDIGGQDTKLIAVEGGIVKDFIMNDKCSAGTGKFLEIMANRLNVTIEELFAFAQRGNVLPISALCTVFAESEVISYIGEGHPREDIAAGIKLADLLVDKAPVFPSKGELRKLAQGGGVSINKEKIADAYAPADASMLLDDRYILVQKGKKNYFLLIAK